MESIIIKTTDDDFNFLIRLAIDYKNYVPLKQNSLEYVNLLTFKIEINYFYKLSTPCTKLLL